MHVYNVVHESTEGKEMHTCAYSEEKLPSHQSIDLLIQQNLQKI